METPVNTSAAKLHRERPKPVKLTEAAAARLQEIMAGADGKYLGLRVGVTNGGCAGMSYTMAYAEDT
jgi:iron-sulfur cluster assembly protein